MESKKNATIESLRQQLQGKHLTKCLWAFYYRLCSYSMKVIKDFCVVFVHVWGLKRCRDVRGGSDSSAGSLTSSKYHTCVTSVMHHAVHFRNHFGTSGATCNCPNNCLACVLTEHVMLLHCGPICSSMPLLPAHNILHTLLYSPQTGTRLPVKPECSITTATGHQSKQFSP